MQTTWDVITTPFGDALAMFTRTGIAALELLDDGVERPLERLTRTYGARGQHVPGIGDDIAAQVREYADGKRRSFDVTLDWAFTSPFTRDVLRAATSIPYGETVTFGELAKRGGHAGAFRATGAACRHSPFIFVVPVHRVVHADGTPAGYAQRPTLKAELLTLEHSTLARESTTPNTPPASE